jgi:hypothetical protein
MLYLNLENQSLTIVSEAFNLYYLETYERKGKLQKKSLNTDKFKERQFVLDKDQLFYYKNEKQSKCFFLLLCEIEDKNFNLIMLGNAQIQIVSNTEYKS